MHLLAAQSGIIDDGGEAVDLAQSPGDIVVISAADSELAALARARDGLGPEAPSLRLANLMQLGHNMSVDLYCEKTLGHARLIVLRLLGGRAYWPYGLDQVSALARERGIALAVLPGDREPDPELQRHSTLPAGQVERLRRYLAAGGAANARAALAFCAHLLGQGEVPQPASEPARTGLYRPDRTDTGIADVTAHWRVGAPVVPIVFYGALLEGGNTEPVDALVDALAAEGLNPLPIFAASLKAADCARFIADLFKRHPPAVILSATGFALSQAGEDGPTLLSAPGCPVLQMVFSGSSREAWEANAQGLAARDLAMNVVLPELDGRVMTRAVSFKADAVWHEATECRIVTYRADRERIGFVAKLAAAWARLGTTPNAEKRIAIVLANYPNRDGRIGNGVGYDTPASTVAILQALAGAGYRAQGFPEDGNALIEALLAGPTNRAGARERRSGATLPLDVYARHFAALPPAVREQVTARWGEPKDDPFVADGAFHLPVLMFGNVAVMLQPARGYNIDPKETYHDPALVPPHGYLAAHMWLREGFGAHAALFNGKHGNLEWLPGKAVALSPACYPEAALGPLPAIYPFIVNDPGEGTQAKRRICAVIVDHLTPPLTRAETYGPLKDLEALIDEYYLASGLDSRRLKLLREHIFELTRASGLDIDSGIETLGESDGALQRLDAYLCDLKEAQIRDGLHILGRAPEGRQLTDLLVALTRVPRGAGEGGDASLVRALAADLGLAGFDPLDCAMGEPWEGGAPRVLDGLCEAPLRTRGDMVERLELLAATLVAGEARPDPRWTRASAVLREIDGTVRAKLSDSARREIASVLTALGGRFVEPGPSGAPTRGRLDVLPTGRNFYSIDNRTLPTPVAWALGEKSAARLVERHFQDHGRWLTAIGLSAWGTSNMRTGGDDIAQAMALIGARPVWDTASWRVTGFDIVPVAKLGRPRVDVTLRISGFFRDAFPAQIDLFDSAVRAIAGLDEPEPDNPIAARVNRETAATAGALGETAAFCRASLRVFGSRPGAYGAGLQALIDEKLWDERADLARAYIAWGAYAYGGGAGGVFDAGALTSRLGAIEAVVHNQDNREHDLLDSDDYYQFEGGMTAAAEHVSGTRPTVYHNDHSRPERPVIRTLEEEIGRVMRSRVANPKWIAGVMRHGYKGAFEIAATVDYLFAFSATTGAVRDHHFQMAYDAFIADETVRGFIEANNPAALGEMSGRFLEAMERGLWTAKSNSARRELERIAGGREKAGTS